MKIIKVISEIFVAGSFVLISSINFDPNTSIYLVIGSYLILAGFLVIGAVGLKYVDMHKDIVSISYERHINDV